MTKLTPDSAPNSVLNPLSNSDSKGLAEQSAAAQDPQDPHVAQVLQGLKAIQTLTALQNAIFKLLASRAPSATICPSDAARAIYPNPDLWRAAMPAVRAVAAQLADKGKLEVTQGGQVVDIRTAKGPVRLRLPRS